MITSLVQFLSKYGLDIALSTLSGCLFFLGFCGFGQWYLAWFCCLPILWVLEHRVKSLKAAFLFSWLFGMVGHLGCYYWIVHVIHVFGHLPMVVGILGCLFLCGAQTTLFAMWGLLVVQGKRKWGIPVVCSSPLVWVILEWLYPSLFQSFLGNSQYQQLVLIQSLDIWGPLGISFLLVLFPATILSWFNYYQKTPGYPQSVPLSLTLGLAGLLAWSIWYGSKRIGEVETQLEALEPTSKTVGMVQTNMGIYEKRNSPAEGLRRHRDQSMQLQQLGVDLILWPESGYFYGIREGTQNVKRSVMGEINTPILFGGVTIANRAPERVFFNSAYLADADGEVLGRYDKIFLLAFGEYIPLGDLFPWLYTLSPNTGRFEPGTTTSSLEMGGIRYGVLICYEDILPSFVRKVGDGLPHVLVNLTNDAWFGDTHEPRIHLALATFRAIEQRRYLLRSTNTGISAIIAPTGRIISESKQFEQENLVGQFVPLTELTIYQRYGNWFGWCCVLGLALLGLMYTRRRRAQA
ncbi:MAG: apolipoprotein N-acyltransferase [Myxococcota bacterium]|nr:apolipoprotein N-acyltransferase [Myxococcota bacterium]